MRLTSNMLNKIFIWQIMFLCVALNLAYAEAPLLKPGMNVTFEHVMDIGAKGPDDGQFQYVEDFDWDINGNLLATDAVNANVQVFDPKTGKFITKFGGPGKDDGKFIKPEGIAVDQQGNIFIADYSTGFIHKFDKNHKFLTKFSDFGDAPGENMDAEFMIVAHNLLYMAEAGNNRVDVFDLDGNFKFMFGGEGTELGKMQRPEAAKVDSAGNIWVCDLGNNRFQKFDKNGNFLNAYGKKGSGPGEFDKPTGLAVGPHDLIYIGEVHNNRIQVFDKDGNFISMYGKAGSGAGEFGNIHGLIVDQQGYVYVADSANNRIQVLKPVVK